MNLVNRHSNNDLLFANFNQDCTCISLGTKHGYKMYNCEPFAKCYGKFLGGTGIVEMLFCTSLVALVGAGEQPAFSPRCLQISNTKRNTTICELPFKTKILAVKMNRKRLVVVLEFQIHIYDISTMKLLHTVVTPSNLKGIVALSSSSDTCYLAYMASDITGEVLIFDCISLQAVTIVQAHKNPLSYLALNNTGDMLATTSDKGTIVRVFSVPNGKKIHQFRRGAYPARVYCLSFDISSTFLACSSDTGTIHLFKIGHNLAVANNKSNNSGINREIDQNYNNQNNARKTSNSVLTESMSNTTLQATASAAWSSISSWVPEQVNDVLQPERDFAFLKLPIVGIENTCAISSSTGHVYVVTSDGYFYQYALDVNTGGECRMIKQYMVLDPNEHLETDDKLQKD